MMKIKSLEVENIKLFDKKFDKIKDISQVDLVLLNGPNGYGKTTIFDVLELALTGEIKRIKIYNDDLGVAKNEKFDKKVLLADPLKEAYVMLTLEEGNCEIRLKRVYEKPANGKKNKVSTDNNPHKIFDKFERKLFINGEEIFGEEQITILKKYHLDNITEFFDKCCFLSQDEHLQFLKETKKDKSVSLEFLFQLPEKQKRELERIDKIISSLQNSNTKNNLGYIQELQNSITELGNKIAELKGKAERNQASQNIGEKEDVKYQCLFPQKGIKWDEESPLLSDDEFDTANREIENLMYFAQHQEACINYMWNKPFRDLLQPNSMLQIKKEYIKRFFYDANSKLILQKQNELVQAEKRFTKLKRIYNELCEYRKAISEGIKDYKRSVIHDIEPLLHVYTAKILQQKFGGKSIFILTDEKMENFQLIHSAEDNQDILYNMSSGQLAAVSLSFLLCMNQVYAQQQSLPILLIDDPIQTIDDVNMVGLVDILRFELKDTQIFISTHEQKFEWYLKYKYEKAGKKMKAYNMKDIVLQMDKISV